MILDTYYYAGNIFKLDDIIDINSIDEIRVWNMHIISPYKIDFCKINNKNIKITFYKRSFEELNTLFLKQKKYKNKHRKLLIKILKDYFWFKSNFLFNNEDNLEEKLISNLRKLDKGLEEEAHVITSITNEFKDCHILSDITIDRTQIDVVVGHSKGLLILEVKNIEGLMEISNNYYVTVSHGSTEYKIHNPIAQLKNSKYKIYKLYKVKPTTYFINSGLELRYKDDYTKEEKEDIEESNPCHLQKFLVDAKKQYDFSSCDKELLYGEILSSDNPITYEFVNKDEYKLLSSIDRLFLKLYKKDN